MAEHARRNFLGRALEPLAHRKLLRAVLESLDLSNPVTSDPLQATQLAGPRERDRKPGPDSRLVSNPPRVIALRRRLPLIVRRRAPLLSAEQTAAILATSATAVPRAEAAAVAGAGACVVVVVAGAAAEVGVEHRKPDVEYENLF